MSYRPSKGTTTTGAAAAAAAVRCTSSGTAKDDEEDDTVLISNSSSSISDDDAGGDQDHQEQHLHHESSANLFIQVKSTDLQQKLEARKRQNSTTNTTTTRRPGYLLPSSTHSISSSSHQREQRRSSVWDSLGKLDDENDLEDSTGSFHSRVLLSPSSSSSHHSRTSTIGRDRPTETHRTTGSSTSTTTINHLGDSALPPRKTTKTPRRGGIVVHSGSLSLSLGGSVSAHTPNPLPPKTTKQKHPRPTSSSGYSSDSYASDIDTGPATRNSFQDSKRSVTRSTSLTVNIPPTNQRTRNNSVPPQERYRRRGSVTQYSLDGCNTTKQPDATPSNHYQPDYDSDLDPKQNRYSMDKTTSAGSSTPPVTVEDMGYEEHIPTKARNRSVPRRGSVTKYSLDQSVTLKDHFESHKKSSSTSSNSSCCSLDRGGGYGTMHATSTTKSINGDRSLGGRPPLSSSAAFTTETVPAKKTRAARRGSVTKYSLELPTAVDYESHDEDEDSRSVVSLPTMSTNRPLGQRLDRRSCLYPSATATPHLAKAIAAIASGTADDTEMDRVTYHPPKPGDDDYSTNLEDSGRLGRRSVSLTDFDDDDDSDEEVAAQANGKQPAHPSVPPVRRWSNDTKPPMHHTLHHDATQVRSPGPAFARLLKKQPIEEDSGHIKKSCFQTHDDVGDDDDDSELRDSDDEFSGEASKIGSRFGTHGRGSTDSKLGKFLERNNVSHLPASPTSLNGTHAVHHSSVRSIQGSSSSRRPSAGGSDTASVVSTTSSIDSASRFRQRRGSMVMASTVETPATINTTDTPVKNNIPQTPFKNKKPETPVKPKTPVKHRTSEKEGKHKTPETPVKLAISVKRKPLGTRAQSPRKLVGCLKTDDNQSDRGWATMSLDKQVRFGSLVILEFPIILGDNPAVTSGAPVTIDWDIQNKTELSVNAYEQFKPKRRRRRKLLISVSQRAILLLAAGYSIDEIADASMLAQNVKDSRKQSLESQSWDRVHFLREATGDAVAGLVQMPAMALQQTGKKLRETLMLVKPQQHSEGARMA